MQNDEFINTREIPLFLCGYPKSGTTLLLSLLDSHPQLNVFPEELKTFTGVLKQKGLNKKIDFILNKTGAYVPKLGIADFPSGKRNYTSINGEDYITSLKNEFKNVKSDKELFLSIFNNWSNFSSNKEFKNNFKYIVEKTPKNEFFIDIIKRWFKQPKFIYIVRDPRDNYLSYKKKHPALTLEEFILVWKKSVKSIKSLSNNELLIIKYEDLTTNLQNTMNKIVDFLDIPYENILNIPTRNGVVWEGNSMFGDNKGTVHISAVERYKEKLDKSTINLIEELLYDELNFFDYPINYATKNASLSLYTRSTFYLKDNIIQYINRLSEIK